MFQTMDQMIIQDLKQILLKQQTAINKTDDQSTYNIYITAGTYKGVGNTNLTVNGNHKINFIGAGINQTILDGEVNYTVGGGSVWGADEYWNPYTIHSGNWGMNITKGTGLITIKNMNIQHMVSTGGSNIATYKTATVDNYGNLKVDNVYFYYNLAGVGAGIRNNANATLVVNNSIFSENRKSSSTGNFGPGVYNNGTATIDNCQFIKNAARWGTVTNDRVLNITNSIFRDGISYDLGSTYKYGSALTANSGNADFFGQYDLNSLRTIAENCTFINNGQTDIWQGKGDLKVNNCIFNESTGIYIAADRTNRYNASITHIIANSSFINMIPSSLFGSLSVSTGTRFAIYDLAQYNTTIENNEILFTENGYGMYISGYTNVRNNTLKNYIYILNGHNNITGNIIDAKTVYAIDMRSDAENNNITNNTIYANIFTGNKAVNDPQEANIIENNIPETGNNINLTNDNYLTYFNQDGTNTNQITNGTIINICSDLYNKNLTFDNVKIYLKNTDDYVLYNCSIRIMPTANAIINKTIINNGNNNAYAILAESNNNLISFNTITANTINPIQAIITRGNSTEIKNNTITISGPSNNIKYNNNYYGVADNIGILVESSENTLERNNITINYTTTQQYGTIEGISIQSEKYTTSNNKLQYNTIKISGDKYVYGLNVLNSENITEENYYTNITSNYYTAAVQLADSNNNNINGYITISSKEHAYGVIISGMKNIANGNTIKCTINNITANKVYAIELVNSNDTEITSRSSSTNYWLFGNYTMLLATYNANNTEIKYISPIFIANKTDVDINDDSDIIKPTSSLIYLTNSVNTTISGISMMKNNMNGYPNCHIGSYLIANNSNNTYIGKGSASSNPTINITNIPIKYINSNGLTINNTTIYSNDLYMINLTNSSNNVITNNYLLNTQRLNGGENSIYKSNTNNNTLFNNTPTVTILTNENYNTLFTNGVLTSKIDIITLGSNIYNKNMTFTEKIELYNPNNYTIYNGTLTFKDNATNSNVESLILNSTDDRTTLININNSDVKLAYLTIYHKNNKNIARTIVYDSNVTDYNQGGGIINCNITLLGPEIKTDNNMASLIAVYVLKARNPYMQYSNVNVEYLTSDKQGNISAVVSENSNGMGISYNNITLKADNNAVAVNGFINNAYQNKINITSNNKATAYNIENFNTATFQICDNITITANNSAVGVNVNNSHVANSYSYSSIQTSKIILNTKNGIVIQINNSTDTRINSNNLVLNATNGIVISLNNTLTTIRTNNITATGNNVTLMNIKNLPNATSTRTVGSNSITLETNSTEIPIILDNVTNMNVTSNDIVSSTATPVIMIKNSNNNEISYNTLSSKTTHGNGAIKEENSTNITIVKNIADIILTNDNYDQFFTNGILNNNYDSLLLGSDIYNKNMTFNSSVIIINPYNHTIYNGTLTFTENASNSKVTGIILNNTRNENTLIINSDKTNITNSTIYHNYNNGKTIIVTTSNVNLINNTITTNGNNMQVLYFANTTNTTNTALNSNNITTNGDKNTIITIFNGARITIQNNNITSIGNDVLVLNISNCTGNSFNNQRSISGNTINVNFTASLLAPTIMVIENSTRTYIQSNNILINGLTRVNPAIKAVNSTGGINYNYILSLDSYGDFLVNGTESPEMTVNNYPSKNYPFTVKININDTLTLVNGTNTIIKINVTDLVNRPVNEGTIRFEVREENFDVTVPVINGVATINYKPTKLSMNTAVITYHDSYDNYGQNSVFSVLNVVKLNTTVIVDPIDTFAGNNITFTAHVYDQNGEKVNTGKLVFKVNGVTLKDDNGNPLYVYVKDGIAQITYKLASTWTAKNYTINVVYGECKSFMSSRSNSTLKLTNRVANVSVLTSGVLKGGNQVTLTAMVSEKDQLVNGGKVIFKMNGVTLKDSNGNPLYANVENGIAKLNYTIPVGMSAKDYTLTAVYSNKFYDRAEVNSTVKILKTNTHIELNPQTYTKGTQTSIYARVLDENNNLISKTTSVCIKVNGKTMIHTTSINGIINATIDTSKFNNQLYNLTIISGENNGFGMSTTTTVLMKA